MSQISKHYTPFCRAFSGLFFLLFFVQISFGQVSGTVFQDYNGNGTRQTTAPAEPTASGITVTAYLPNGSSVVTTTNANGVYTFTAAQIASGTQVRLEFTGFPNGMFDGFSSAQSKSSEQFVTAGAAANAVNFAVNVPSNYCQTNPPIAVDVSPYGTDAAYGTKTDNNVIVTMVYNSSGTNQSLQTSVPSANAGSLWGTGFRKQTRELFGAAFMKRHAFFGVGGPGAIYRTTNITGGGAQATTVFITLPNASDPHNLADKRLDEIRTVNGIVLNPFDAVGKMGLGGVDVSDDGKFMYAVNLFNKRLYRIALNGSPAAAPTAADTVSFPIPNPNCTKGVARPFACHIHPITGNIFVGVTCTGENGGTAADMFSYAYEFNTTTNTFAATPAAILPLSYPRSNIVDNTPTNSSVPNGWYPWINNWDDNNNIPAGGMPLQPYYYPQPLLSGFAFDADGSMVMGIMDRFSHQAVFQGSDANGNTFGNQTFSGGDIVRFCNTGTLIAPTYTREAAGKCGANGSGTTGYNIGDPNPAEYYGGDYPINNDCCHAETGMGAIAILPGSGELLAGAIDPQNLFSSGFIKLNNLTGLPASPNSGYEIVGTGGDYPPALYGKGSGLGDIAILCNPSPIEIGNRVWLDTNGDGIQDPNEAPIVGVVINLYADVNKDGIADNATIIGTATTAADGTWYFNNSNVADGDPSTAGNQIGLAAGMGYVVQIASSQFNSTGSGPLANLAPTVSNTGGGAGQADVRDSDASLVAGLAQIAVVTGDAGENNHTLDFGFRSAPTCVIPTAPALSVANNTCSPVVAGTINVTTACGAGTHIEYSTDNGSTWSATAPTYGSSPITVVARCVTDADATCFSSNSAAVTTAPVTCPPPPPAPPCSITITQQTQSVCNNSGTNNKAQDDYFTVSVNATAISGGAQYEVVNLANTDGTGGNPLGFAAYGTAVTVGSSGNLIANNTAYTLTIRDTRNNACFKTITLNPVPPCSSNAGAPPNGPCGAVPCAPIKAVKNGQN